ncbi:6-aminohexanoate-dimer hydrolase [Sulfitobacter noctilucae]|uniref:serine hydrolase domain-containing protein n=1 Tax=Sulfitobacter noctilucae TaxID=1342302 RepID=UPI000469E8D0|nr:serine hydrolase [Sulfitobacter noctilucae]KIN60205.1 6-aminohexanoate-dimer hydrolase [Sulfitobacter noctilucae]
MRTFGKWLGRILLVLAVAALAIGLWKRDEITRLMAVLSLFSEEEIVSNFSNMDAAFLHTSIDRGTGPTSELPYGPETELPPQVADWITDRTVTALVVLKEGAIVYEDYFQGTTASDRRISWSVAKSYLSALVGILIDEGAIASIDDPVIKYVPGLRGTAYDGATLRNVLQMSSGVTFDEDYLDQSSDINKMGRVLALGGKMDDFTTALTETFAAPGETWKYVSIDTHVVGMVVRGATGRSVADLLSEKVIQPLGLEYAPYYLTDGVGTAFVLGGLNMTTRDYARFGQMFAQGGAWQGQQVVPRDWVAASTQASAPTDPGAIGYGYQWWIPVGSAPGEYMGRGIYGQYVYVDTSRGVVIASNAADRRFRDPGVAEQNIEIFRAIAQSL